MFLQALSQPVKNDLQPGAVMIGKSDFKGYDSISYAVKAISL